MPVYIPYVGTGSQSQVTLGHYATGQASGAIAATPTALDPHASIRWAPSITAYLVLMRLRLGWAAISEITTAVRMAYQAHIARSFVTDYGTTNSATAINLATTGQTNQMRANMNKSLMGANGPKIAGTGSMSTSESLTFDAAPIGMYIWSVQGIISGGVKVSAGVAGPTATIYEWTGLGQHPVVLTNNEGVVCRLVHTGWASGTVSIYSQWEWAECLTF